MLPRCLLALLLHAAAFAAQPEAPAAQADPLYQEFEALNTPENLGRRFVGGQPPQFIQQQTRLLQAIAAGPAREAAPVLTRIADEFLQRVQALGERGFRLSPLQALQLPLVDALARHASADDVRARLGRLAKSPATSEYARGRALDALVGHALAQLDDDADPKGERRARLLLDGLVGEMALPALLHAPARLRALAARAPALAKGDATAPWRALAAAAGSPAKRYAADAALALATAQRDAKGQALGEQEKALLLEACGRWLKDFRPVVAQEKYPSDLLGQALLHLAARPGHDALARALRDAGVTAPDAKK